MLSASPKESARLSRLHELAASTDNKSVKRWASKSLAEIESFSAKNPHDGELLHWYFQTFCTGWGYLQKNADGRIYKCSRRLTPHFVAEHLGLAAGSPTYFGVAPDNTTSWAIVDIDSKSQYHPTSDDGDGVEPVIDALTEIGLKKPVELQSSFSTGIHLLYGLIEPVPTWQLAESLVAAAKKADLKVKAGVLEFFPNRKKKESAYNCVRAPLSGEGNAIWIGNFGFDESLEIFRMFFEESQCKNRLNPLRVAELSTASTADGNHYIDDRYTNTRGQHSNSSTLKAIEDRLAVGFTSSAQTQELQFAALQLARFRDGASTIDELRNAASKLLTSAPGFTEFCGHQRAIESGRYWCNSTLRKTLRFSESDYAKSWHKIANDRKQAEARRMALEALQKANLDGARYRNRLAAFRGLSGRYGAPSKSWFHTKGEDLLHVVDELVDSSVHMSI